MRAKNLAALALALAATATRAGPPFVTDDPEPTDSGHWEVYNFVAGSHVTGETAGQAGFDINYGGAKDLQLTAVVPFHYRQTNRTGAGVGLGSVELAVKYRLIHQRAGSLLPDVAVFPRLLVPTDGVRGTRRLDIFLPLWAQKDLGKWSLFGGGGYTINPGRGRRDFWLEGVGATRTLGDRFMLGAEIIHQARDSGDARASTGINVGGLYRLGRHWSLIGSAGPGVENARQQGLWTFYSALKADY